MKPRVALDARLTRQMSVGMQAYAREMASRLPSVAPDIDFVTFSEGPNFGWNEQVALPLAIRRARAQLAHFLSLYMPVVAPRPYIVTVHDLIHLRFPHYFKSKVRPYYAIAVRFACTRAARVITDDERTVEDLKTFLRVDPERVCVVPLGADEIFSAALEPFRARRPYVMYAGNHRPHKDLPTLFEAWAGLPSSMPLDLYVTGEDDFGQARLRYSREHGRIVALGDVSPARLAAYYAGAAAYVHPALYEGFGLPILEAMAAGCPVIASDCALPSVLREAALTFRAGDAEAARAAMLSLLENERIRGQLVVQGRSRAKALTWDRCAQQTAAVYRAVLQEHAR